MRKIYFDGKDISHMVCSGSRIEVNALTMSIPMAFIDLSDGNYSIRSDALEDGKSSKKRFGLLCVERNYAKVAVTYNDVAIHEAVDYQISENGDGITDITLRLKVRSPVATFSIATTPEAQTS